MLTVKQILPSPAGMWKVTKVGRDEVRECGADVIHCDIVPVELFVLTENDDQFEIRAASTSDLDDGARALIGEPGHPENYWVVNGHATAVALARRNVHHAITWLEPRVREHLWVIEVDDDHATVTHADASCPVCHSELAEDVA